MKITKIQDDLTEFIQQHACPTMNDQRLINAHNTHLSEQKKSDEDRNRVRVRQRRIAEWASHSLLMKTEESKMKLR